MSKVAVTGHVAMTRDEFADLESAFAEHVALSRPEPGCERFEFGFRDGPPSGIHVDELYRDRCAFEAHKEGTSGSESGRVGAHLARCITVRDAG
jgi:quinol monooxygenase YgiN